MRKDLNDMSPDELRREKAYQEEHFQHLVSNMKFPESLPKTWYDRWWSKWKEAVTTTASIVGWTIVICGVVVGLMVIAITMVAATSA